MWFYYYHYIGTFTVLRTHILISYWRITRTSVPRIEWQADRWMDEWMNGPDRTNRTKSFSPAFFLCYLPVCIFLFDAPSQQWKTNSMADKCEEAKTRGDVDEKKKKERHSRETENKGKANGKKCAHNKMICYACRIWYPKNWLFSYY